MTSEKISQELAKRVAPTVLVLMGVSGSGKSTVAVELQRLLGWPFQEGDDLHPPANVEKMRSGQPLTDQDRLPWLRAVAAWIDARLAAREPGIITCSNLKRAYREITIDRRRGVTLVYLKGDQHVIAGRLRRQRVTRHVTGHERQHLAALLVDAERQRRAGEPGVAQVGQVRLHGQAERSQRPPHRVPDPNDPLGDAIPDQRFAFAHPQQPSPATP